MLPIIDAVAGVFSGVVKPILDKWIPDASERLKAEQAILGAGQAVVMAQIEINKAEAQSSSIFVAGWRPAIGWVCAGSLLYAVLGYNIMNWIFHVISLWQGAVIPTLPPPDTTITMEILLGMLGLGGYRTYEKLKGVAS